MALEIELRAPDGELLDSAGHAVIGYGNPLRGDDGAGYAAAELLRTRLQIRGRNHERAAIAARNDAGDRRGRER